MKHYLLKLLAKELQKYSYITFIKRVDDNAIKIEFDNKDSYIFDLSKSNSSIYPAQKMLLTKSFNAPFDVILQKLFFKSKIVNVYVLPNDRILKFEIIHTNSYKQESYSLQLEFTGKNTNAIILNEKEIIIEALRHISEKISSRPIKVGERLKELPFYEIREKKEDISDIKEYLRAIYEQKTIQTLQKLKEKAIITIQKKEEKILETLNKLENEHHLQKLQQEYKKIGDLILSKIDEIEITNDKLELLDFEGNLINIAILPQIANKVELAEYYYQESKKLRQKAQNIWQRRENLNQKLSFYELLKESIKSCKTKEELEIYLGKNKNKSSKKEDSSEFESFYVDEYKIMLGRSKKENIRLLEISKADDLWLHIKDMPSSHVIIRGSKKSIPKEVINFAAKLCVDFSGYKSGTYLVDMTKRKNVKIVQEADVLYTNYETLCIKKED